jgi:hypothetical protein
MKDNNETITDDVFVKILSENISKNTKTTPRTTDTTYGHVVSYNKKKYRSPEFTNNVDLLTAGCSFTFGTGLPYYGIWSNMIAKSNNFSHNSVSMQGGSVMHIVFNIFKYFEEFGHPKILLALLPDFNRIYTFIDGVVLYNTSRTDNKGIGIFDDPGPSLKHSYPKYISLPTSPEHIYSKESTYFLNSMYVRMLEVYCNSHNIPFVWFKWTEENLDKSGALSSFSNIYKVDINNDLLPYSSKNPNDNIHKKCHQEERKYFISDTDIWSSASDNGHFGIHWQIHVKELFEKVLKEKGLT